MVASRLVHITLALLLLATTAHAKHLHPEKIYQNEWCNKFSGQQEYRLEDNTRVDCLTKNYAVEFDFAAKWAECLGQALHYANLADKRPACVLIIEHGKDWKHYKKLRRTAKKHAVKIWYITPKDITTP